MVTMQAQLATNLTSMGNTNGEQDHPNSVFNAQQTVLYSTKLCNASQADPRLSKLWVMTHYNKIQTQRSSVNFKSTKKEKLRLMGLTVDEMTPEELLAFLEEFDT
jgi:hypothetical protein